MKTIINVSNRLPITLGDTIEKSSGGVVSAFDDIRDSFNVNWVGWVGQEINDPHEQIRLNKLLNEQGLSPLYLTKKEINEYYHSYSNSILWPILHSFSTYIDYKSSSYQIYKRVNYKFAKYIKEIAPQGSLVWIHDYHLMLLPKMLRMLRPDLKIGFFLHTPFPSSELFRCLPQREELLEGLLGADLIGFQTFSDFRHFKSSVLRILKLEADMETIHADNHNVHIEVFPIGISWNTFSKVLNSSEYKQKLQSLKEHYQGQKVVLSVERLDYSKGIPEKLNAIERFLNTYPKLRNKVVFIQIAIPTREHVEPNKIIEEEITRKISCINGKFSAVDKTPIHFIFHTVSPEELCALYTLADVALVTPLRDGMNLVAKEYVSCKSDSVGNLILSEFAGASQELFAADIINPYDTELYAKRIYAALAQQTNTNKAIFQSMRQNIIKNNSLVWAKKFIEQLSVVPEEVNELEHANNKISPEDIGRIKNDSPLALFIDYDGTLREFENDPDKASPSKEIKDIIKSLARKNIEIYLISGRSTQDLEKWFGKININLISEHGYFWRQKDSTKWQLFVASLDLSWKKDLTKIFEHFVQTTPGTFLEEKNASLVWHYRKADPEFAKFKATQLIEVLYSVAPNLPIEIHHSQKNIEVSSVNISKGAIVSAIIADKPFKTILCAGDATTDETIFKLEDPRIIAIKVGTEETVAPYRFSSPAKFREFLRGIYS